LALFPVTLSFRDVEDLLAERGIMVSYETVRRWVNHFGPMIAADLRKRRPKPHMTWHLDEVYLKIDGRMVYLWRAVDAEGEVLDVLVQTRLTWRFHAPFFSITCERVSNLGRGGFLSGVPVMASIASRAMRF
jgi:transposase-like protein